MQTSGEGAFQKTGTGQAKGWSMSKSVISTILKAKQERYEQETGVCKCIQVAYKVLEDGHCEDRTKESGNGRGHTMEGLGH